MLLIAAVVALLVSLAALAAAAPRHDVTTRVRAGERGQLPNIFAPGTWKNIWSSISGGVGDIVGIIPSLVDTLGTLTTIIASLLANTGSTIFTAISDGVSLIWGAIANFASGLFTIIQDGVSLIWGVIANLASGLFTRIEDTASLIWGVIANLASGLFGRIEDAASLVWGVLANFASGIFSRIDGAVTLIWQAIVNLASGLFSHIADAAVLLWQALVNLASGLFGRIEAIGTELFHIGTAIENVGQTAVEKGIDAADGKKAEILKVLLGLGIPGGLAALIVDELLQHTNVADLMKWAGEKAEDAGKKAFSEVIDHTIGWGTVTPEEAPGLALGLLAAQTLLGAALHDVAISKEFVPFLDNTATAHLSAFLGKFTGWEPTINAVFDPVVHNGIGRPMEQLINQHTLTNLPGEGILSQLLGRRDIDPSLYDDQLGSHGFRPFWRTVFEPGSFRPARIFELVRIMENVDIDDDQLQTLLQTASYPDDTIAVLLPVLKKVALSRSHGKLITEANEAFQKGFIDAGQYAAALDFAGIKPTEQGAWQLAATASYNNQVKTELLSAWSAAAGRDGMTDDELRAACAVIGLTGGKVEVEVLRAQAKRLKKPTVDVNKAHEKAVNQARATFATAYRKQFQKGLIDEGALSAALIAIGYEPIQADAFVTLAEAEKFKTPTATQDDTPEAVSRRVHADLESAYIAQFQHDLIDAGQLRGALVLIGVNDFEAASIVAREQAKKTPSPVEISKRTADRVAREVLASLKRAYAQQFQDGLISAGDLESQLVAAGMDPDSANAFRLQQEAISFHPAADGQTREEKLHARQLEAARKAAAIEVFRVGLSDAAALRDDLIAAGIAADIVDAIVTEELARAAAPATSGGETAAQRHARELLNAQKAAAIQQFRHKIIGAAELFDALTTAGIADDVATALVEAEIARATKPAATPTPPAT